MYRLTRDAYSFLPTLGETDLFLFGKGDERRIYDKLGAQLRVIDGVPGTSFAVWAPNAQRVSVVGDFNGWDGRCHPMRLLGSSGVWELFVPGLGEGTLYKYEVKNVHGDLVLKADPYGFFFETPPKNASIVWNNRKFAWTDDAWLERRRPKRAEIATQHLRGASGFLAEEIGGRVVQLSRVGRPAGAIRQTTRIFARGIAARCRNTPSILHGGTR